jgi:hypothetical protein
MEYHKNITGKVHTSDNMPPPFKLGNTVVPMYTAAGAFSSYFLYTTGSLNVQNVKGNAPILFLRDAYPNDFPPMNMIPVTEAEIKSVIITLKAKESPGHVKISSKILKLCRIQII